MSGAFLAVDCGNTRIKFTRLSPDCVTECRVCAPQRIHEAKEFVAGTADGCALLASGDTGRMVSEWIERECGIGVMVITPDTPVPIGINYGTPGTLGLDRKATAVAVAGEYPGEGVVVVDAGTALTIDHVSPPGCFEGGTISPGIAMRLRALHECTAHLPEIIPDSAFKAANAGVIGTDTVGAISAGAIWGIAAETAMAIAMASRQYGVRKAVVTGGDGKRLAELLLRYPPEGRYGTAGLGELLKGVDIKHDPHLLAKGMKMIYEFVR